MAINTTLRYNPESGEVELVVGESVAMSSGKEVFDSWGAHWAEANGYSKAVVTPNEPVENKEVVVEPELDSTEEV